ncbi:MAG: DUF6939 family protein [Candidatus Hermodarchaeia archaeon]|jgi:hypothetical protein
MIYTVRYNAKIPEDAIAVDPTSRSKGWDRGLSPFFVGPVDLCNGFVSQNFENAWQFCKVYKQHVGPDGEPTDEYWEWAKKGWEDSWAHRYPMGRGAIPEYSQWLGEKLGYIAARKRIYIPVYSTAVKKTKAYNRLMEVAKQAEDQGKDLYIRDFDGYNNKELGMSYDDVINCESRKMGHGFVLAMLLDVGHVAVFKMALRK